MSNSIYGPGVLNDTIVPGYGVTKFPVNLDTFWQLPNRTTRNFGEATQYTTYPMGRPQFMYDLAQNFTAPNHISNWDPMLLSTGINFNSQTTNPYLTQQGQMDAFNWGANMVQQMQVQQAVQGIAQALNSMESSLSGLVNSDKLTNAQKATLKGLLEEVKALKSKIEAQLKAKNPTQEEVTAMQKEVMDLQKKVSESADKIRAEVNGAGNDSSASNSSSASDSSNDSSDLSDTEYKDVDPKTGRPNELGDAPEKSEIRNICSKFYNAVNDTHWYTLWTCGTDDEKFEEALNELNENNIVEVMQFWDKNYNSSNDKKNTFIYNFLDDAEHYQKREFGTKILNALIARAEANGIEDEISADATAVSKELSDANISKGIVAKHIMAIYNKIVEKETANKKGAEEALEGKKTENNKQAEQRKQEVTTEKKNEIANKVKEALKLKEVPQLSSALKIETDANGEFTGYSIELDTQNGKVKVTGQTYQELALAIENNGLEVEDVLVRKTQA